MLRKANVKRLSTERIQRIGVLHNDDLAVKVSLNITIERSNNVFRWLAIGLCRLVWWPVGDERRVKDNESRVWELPVKTVLGESKCEGGMKDRSHSLAVS